MRRLQLPRFEKVLFCLPLRLGIIILVYFNLILTLVTCIMFEYFDFVKIVIRSFTMHTHDIVDRMGRSKIVPEFVIIFLLFYMLAELIMSIVVLIGLHKKMVKLILVHMYYTLASALLLLTCRLLDVGNIIWYLEVSADIIYFGFKFYFVLLIRSLIKKLMTTVRETESVLELEMRVDENNEEIYSTDLETQNIDIDKILSDKTLD